MIESGLESASMRIWQERGVWDNEYIIFIQELNKLESAIMRQDRYVELFGEHRALLQVIRVVKRKYMIGCDV
jgi:hypothetical protein